MKRLCLLACLAGLPLPALAASPVTLQPGVVLAAVPVGQEAGRSVVLFAPGPGGRVSGGVASAEGDLICPEAWQARASVEDDTLSFTEITLAPAPCESWDALRDFATRLGRVGSEVVTDEGILLMDAAGQPLLRLTVAG